MKKFKFNIILIALIALTVSLVFSFSCDNGEDKDAIYSKARIETVNTDYGPLDILYVQGTTREIGLQYGYYLNSKIASSYDAFLNYLRQEGVPEILSESGLNILWSLFKPFVPDSYLEEIDAIVEGAKDAGVTIDASMLQRTIALANISDLDTTFLDPILQLFTCSSFAVWGPRTVNGKLFASRNLDWNKDTGIENYKLLTVYKPQNGAGFVTMGYAGFIGALAGMNEYGITIGEIGSTSVNQKLLGKPWVLKTRDILATAGNLDNAIGLFKNAPNTIGYNFVIGFGDPQGNGAGAKGCALETNADMTAVLYDNDSREQNAYAINHQGDPVLDGNGQLVYYGYPLPYAIYRADTAFDPQVRKDQTASHGPGADNYDPLTDSRVEGDPHGSGAYDSRYMPQYQMINAFYEGTGYVRNGVTLIPADGVQRIIGLEEARQVAAVAASPSSCILSVVYSATDLKFLVAYEKGEGDSWQPAQASQYYQLNLRSLLDSM